MCQNAAIVRKGSVQANWSNLGSCGLFIPQQQIFPTFFILLNWIIDYIMLRATIYYFIFSSYDSQIQWDFQIPFEFILTKL